MLETTQAYLALETENRHTAPNFQTVLDYIRENARSERQKGDFFERLMRTYFTEDPDYKQQFSEVYLWKEWAELSTDFDGTDIGVDLVAQKHDGTYCAIQCKCYAEDTRVSKPHLDSFISASASDIFTSRIFVNTGGELGDNLIRTIDPLGDTFRIIRFSDLESSPFVWPDLSVQEPEQLTYQQRRFSLKDHQQEAFDDVINGFKEHDRGKLIMACGTGKTFTALKIAEHIAGTEGRVLYLVPSISLLSQAMREWSEQRGIDHSYVGICSDTRAGSTTEDSAIQELKIPVTTDPSEISHALCKQDTGKMTVVFCTYQSLPRIETAQDNGAPPFDIIFCDEAHRTTGVEHPGDDPSHFRLVHDNDRIRANKRLYMTATPKIYTENARTQAAAYDVEVFSMNDERTYGPEFHKLSFSKAVAMGELSDYKVVVLAISEGEVNAALQGNTGDITINDATKIIGCWRALQNPEISQMQAAQAAADTADITETDTTLAPIKPLKRVIAFTNTIAQSKALYTYWNPVVENTLASLPEDQHPTDFECETKHVDGTDHALNRKARLDWLKGDTEGTCRILSNARCLSEGIDVPALDAVIFMTPRNSHVDVVQAVGRVMRKAAGKAFGYIILPVAIPENSDPAAALDDNKDFAKVWSVLRALRSHDDRLNAEINSIDLNQRLPQRIIFGGAASPTQMFLPLDIPLESILPRIVEQCGDRRYWDQWAEDVADIFTRLVSRIENLLQNPENAALQEWFDAFHTELKSTINDAITRTHAIDMMAQHILTKPVFDALFEDYDFSSRNPVANALDTLQKDFAEFGLVNETRDLQGFYESVQTRASGVKTSDGRQQILSDLYEQFFKKALKKEADRLGIAYTPIELVDFVIHSVNEILKTEFGHSLSDEGVRVLDPFTGTGTFIVRLLQSGLIHPDDLHRKYREELFANEIVLLAYYIAAVNIEEAYRGALTPPSREVDTDSLTDKAGKGGYDSPSASPLDKGGKGGSASLPPVGSASPLEKGGKGGSNSLPPVGSASPLEKEGKGSSNSASPVGSASPLEKGGKGGSNSLPPVGSASPLEKEGKGSSNSASPVGSASPLDKGGKGGSNSLSPAGSESPTDNAGNGGYEPFTGIVLTDTFNLNKKEEPTLFPKERLQENNERAENQEKLPIQVIIGNPPWKAKRKNAAEDVPNVKYPKLRQRVRETYAAKVKTKNKNTLYDSYKMAIRWASDRIEDHGIVGFVTSASWIDGIVDAGIRACLPEEFSSVYFLNLRGKAQATHSEGEGVFRDATQSPVAIVILVKNPNATHEGCIIHYREIGDALKREAKLAALREATSVFGFNNWRVIMPNEQHDWIEHRSDLFERFYPLGSNDARDGKADDAIFKLYSRGITTGRDPHLYNFSHDTCTEKAKRMTQEYLDAILKLEENPELSLSEVTSQYNSEVKWDEDLESNLKQRKKTKFQDKTVRKTLYRPFISMNCYADHIFIQRKYQMARIFPDASSENRVICIPGKGAKKQFSTLVTDTIVDVNLNEAGTQCFPRWRYPKTEDTSHSPIELLNINGGG